MLPLNHIINSGIPWEVGKDYNPSKGLAEMQGFFYFGRMFSFDISKLPFTRGILVTLMVFTCVISPAWYLFQFANHIFRSLELFKLLIVASAIGVPLFILNLTLEGLLISIFGEINVSSDKAESKNEDEIRLTSMNSAMTSTILVFYFPIIATFLESHSLMWAIITSIIIQITLVWGDYRKYKQNKDMRRKLSANQEPTLPA